MVKKLKEMVVRDVDQFFKKYGEYITPSNSLINDILAIKGRFNRITNDEIRGVLSPEERKIQLNEITNSLLKILDQLDESDYIHNLSESEIQSMLVHVNSRLVNSQEQIEKLKKQLDSLSSKNHFLENSLVELQLMILENRIYSYDTHDANLETNNIVRYLGICKANKYWYNLKIDSIINAIVKYSKKYPDLPDFEKNDLIEALNNLELSVVNQNKVKKIIENFGLKTEN